MNWITISTLFSIWKRGLVLSNVILNLTNTCTHLRCDAVQCWTTAPAKAPAAIRDCRSLPLVWMEYCRTQNETKHIQMRRQHGPHSVVPLVNPFTKENMLLCCETNCFLFLYFSGARHALNAQLCAWRDIFRSGYILCWLVVIPLLPYVPPPPQATHTCCTCMWMNPWEWQRLPCISTHSSTASMQHIRIGYMHVFAVHSPNPKAECTNPTQAQVHAPFVLTTTTRGLRMHFKIVLFHLWTSDSLETDFKLVSCSISDMGFFSYIP